MVFPVSENLNKTINLHQSATVCADVRQTRDRSQTVESPLSPQTITNKKENAK
jgi:hypothetical protein